MLAHPLETIESGSTETVARRVQKIAAERQVDCVVVGLPKQMNGTLGLAAENAQRFVEKLRPLVSCEVLTWDERLSTVATPFPLRQWRAVHPRLGLHTKPAVAISRRNVGHFPPPDRASRSFASAS